MKKITFLFLLIFALAMTQAQNYQISFAGNGACTNVDSVEVENLTQCTHTSIGGSDTLHLTATLGISELNAVPNDAVRIFPNPMTGNCSVDFIAIAQGKTNIGLFDMTGNRILQVQELLSKGHQTYSLSGISIGIYMLKIESDKYSYTAKIVSTITTLGIAEIKHVETMPCINEQITTSNTGKLKSLKSIQSVIYMQYTTGDLLMLTGKSGIYRTIFMLVPTQNQTVTFNFVACTDADGNDYSIIQIDTIIWMAENLKTTKYRTGDTILHITNDTAWDNPTSAGAYCNYNNTTNSDTINTYGRLYNWYAVNNSSNIAPQGWHVASDSEWTALTTYLGGDSVAGGKMKGICPTLWYGNIPGETNESGFTAVPSGLRITLGTFVGIGGREFFWSSTQFNTINAWIRVTEYSDNSIQRVWDFKKHGYSVRCVKN